MNGHPETSVRSDSSTRWGFLAANATVFTASACVMIMELVAGRLVARYLGQSLYSWTAVIGVVLAGLSIGSYAGGFLADRVRPRAALSALFIFSAVSCMLVLPITNYALRWTWLLLGPWPVRIFVTVLASFLLPSTALGAISPVVARMALLQGHRTGRTLGDVYASGTAGSIFGTFLAGFWLIGWIGSTATTVAVASVLTALAILHEPRSIPGWIGGAAMLGVLFAAAGPGVGARGLGERWGLRAARDPGLLFSDESQYQYVAVRATATNGTTRGMYLDKMLHSEMDVNEPTNLLYRYSWVYEAILDKFSPSGQPVSAFVIGGGGYTFPTYLALTRPGSRVDVAEIDPMVTEAARAACGFVDRPEIRVHHADARNFVSSLVEQKRRGADVSLYEYVFGDTFNDYSVPYHLTTREFTEELAGLMTEKGMYLLNMIDRFDSGRFLGSIVLTFREVFPCVEVFYCHANLASRGTYVVVASKAPVDLSGIVEAAKIRHGFLGQYVPAEKIDELLRRGGAMVLTDDHAPVENLLAEVVSRDRVDSLDVYYLDDGLSLAAEGKLDEAIHAFEEALKANPGNAQALYNIGVAWMQKGDSQRALEAFEMALRINPAYIEVRNNAGVVLAGLGQYDAARIQFEEILTHDPGNVSARINLASILAHTGNPEAAKKWLQEAVALAPTNATARGLLERIQSPSGR